MGTFLELIIPAGIAIGACGLMVLCVIMAFSAAFYMAKELVLFFLGRNRLVPTEVILFAIALPADISAGLALLALLVKTLSILWS